MITPFMIPHEFYVNDPTVIRGPFTNTIETFHELTLNRAQEWQRWIGKNAEEVEIENHIWSADLMELSMTPELNMLVHDDLEDVDKDSAGGIMTSKIMTDHMALHN